MSAFGGLAMTNFSFEIQYLKTNVRTQRTFVFKLSASVPEGEQYRDRRAVRDV